MHESATISGEMEAIATRSEAVTRVLQELKFGVRNCLTTEHTCVSRSFFYVACQRMPFHSPMRRLTAVETIEQDRGR